MSVGIACCLEGRPHNALRAHPVLKWPRHRGFPTCNLVHKLAAYLILCLTPLLLPPHLPRCHPLITTPPSTLPFSPRCLPLIHFPPCPPSPLHPQDLEEVSEAAEALATTAELMLDECPDPDAVGEVLGQLTQQVQAAQELVAAAVARARS